MSDSNRYNRIAKNTLFLYLRMMFTMIVSLYTSRIVLNTLGINDYGIRNVVGGFVSTFSLVSATMNSTISRFLTYEIGRGDVQKLKIVFSTSLNIQFFLSFIIVVLGETFGLWFLYNEMEIPVERVDAASWVFHCSLITFVMDLISVPYSSILISREKMGIYAYISILDVSLQLLIVYLLLISSWDKLITYAVLLMIVSFVMRIIYGVYCKKHFEESKYSFVYDKKVVKEMLVFSGYNYLGAAAYILRYQGLNVLTNLFFGVAVNAARGIVAAVEASVSQFVGNFMMALNPPITKAYAKNDLSNMHILVCQGAKYSFYMMMVLVLPIIFEAPIILRIWLKIVPDYTVLFMRMMMVIVLFDVWSNPITTAILATGNLKLPQLVLSPVMMMVFPVTYILFKIGFPAYYAYVVFGIVVALRIVIELFFLEKMISLSTSAFVKKVMTPSILVLIVSLLPFLMQLIMRESLYRLILIVFISIIWSSLCIYFIGMTNIEKNVVLNKVCDIYRQLKKLNKYDKYYNSGLQ